MMSICNAIPLRSVTVLPEKNGELTHSSRWIERPGLTAKVNIEELRARDGWPARVQ